VKAWDTNLLIRHLTEDDRAQLRSVRAELEKARRAGKSVWLSDIVMVEAAWVLQGYGLSKMETLDALEAVVDDARFQTENGAGTREAIERARVKGDLAEHLIALSARRAGANKTQTFDEAVAGFPEFEVLA
jgi:predicted nucleic-acid-binding protein